MLVLEGADLTGKTTLARLLNEKLGVPTHHLGRPPAHTRHWDIVQAAMRNNTRRVIYDRMCIGSYVYGPLLNDEYNKEPVTRTELEHWARRLARRGDGVVWCYADRSTITERFQQVGDWYLDLPFILRAAEIYEDTFRQLHESVPELHPMVYNTSDGNEGFPFFWATFGPRITAALCI